MIAPTRKVVPRRQSGHAGGQFAVEHAPTSPGSCPESTGFGQSAIDLTVSWTSPFWGRALLAATMGICAGTFTRRKPRQKQPCAAQHAQDFGIRCREVQEGPGGAA